LSTTICSTFPTPLIAARNVVSLHDRRIVVEMGTFYCHAAPTSYAMKALKDLGSKVHIAKFGKCVCNEKKTVAV